MTKIIDLVTILEINGYIINTFYFWYTHLEVFSEIKIPNVVTFRDTVLRAQAKLEAETTTVVKLRPWAFQNIKHYYKTLLHEKDVFDQSHIQNHEISDLFH